MDMDPGDMGPSFLAGTDPGDEDQSAEEMAQEIAAAVAQLPGTPPVVPVTLELNSREYEAISNVFVAALMMVHSEIFFADHIGDEGRDFYTQLAGSLGLRSTMKLSLEEAKELRKKLAQATIKMLKETGVDLEKLERESVEHMKELGFDVQIHSDLAPFIAGEAHDHIEAAASPDQEGSAVGDTPTPQASGGSEPEPGPS